MCTFSKCPSCIVCFLQLQLSADVEVVFARGTVTPEQQKKIPLTQTQDEEHTVDGDLLILSVILCLQKQSNNCLKLFCFQKTQC